MTLCCILFAVLTALCISTPMPNIIFILTDDMGNADASFNFKITNPSKANDPPIITHNLDYLAENGIILSQHYSHHVCAPSRCALITSILAHNLGNPFATSFGGNLKPGLQTIAHELSDRGYKNHFVGKWGIDYDNRTYNKKTSKWQPNPLRETDVGPLGRGFNTFYGMYSSGHNHFTKKIRGILDWHFFNDTHLFDAPYGFNEEADKSSTTLITRRTVDIIKQSINIESKPFFIHVSYSAPHDPLQIEDKYLNINNFPFCYKSKSIRRRLYCGMIAAIDEGVGKITKILKDNNILDNTIIIFASDNGGFMNVGGFNYPYRGVKSTSFEGGIRTLAFIYGLYNEQKGKIYKDMFHLVDWAPTLLSYIDSTQNKPFKHKMGDQIDGIDLSKTLKLFDNGNGNYNTNKKQLKYRNKLIAQSEGHNLNITTYIEGDYKLILGTIDFDDIFYEPDDEWCVSSKTRKWHYIIMDLANYIIENTVGSPNFFFLEWAFTFRVQRIYDYFNGIQRESDPNINPEDMPFIVPILNWNEKNVEKRIKLFNLKNDKSESNNLAFKNKEKVEQMYKNLKNELIKTSEIVDEDMFGHISRIFEMFSIVVFGGFIALFIIILLVLFCIMRCIFCSKPKPKTKSD